VAEAYGVVHAGRGFPERWTFYIGKDGVIKAIDQNVNPGGHGKDVAKKLEELGIPKK
jgi:peroxiredoxin Q/BCP